MKRRIGIIGYGKIGKFLSEKIVDNPNLELGFVWNRSLEVLHQSNITKSLILEDLAQFSTRNCDLIIEVAHPCIVAEYGEEILKHCDLMVGSPTAFVDRLLENRLKQLVTKYGVYIPSGALWGAQDIRKMADLGTLNGLKVTMTKHPSSLKLTGKLHDATKDITNKPKIIYDGSVRELCPLAPNNTNTMAAAAVAAHNIGFDGVQGCLVADPNLRDWHYVQIDVIGPGDNGKQFTIQTIRKNPADCGAVTGSATFNSFLSSMLEAHGKGPGFHLC